MFAYRLCEHLGAWHPDYLLDVLTAEQLIGWQRYETQVGRLGVARDDIHWGLLISSVRNVFGGHSRPQQCMPYYDPFAEDIDEDEMAARLGV